MIDKLRQAMKESGLDMLVVVSRDEHLNEYLPIQNRRLQASTTFENSSGFSGSAGTAIICVKGRSHLFVDSRYHLQAEQTCSEKFEIHKMGNKGVIEPYAWIAYHSKNSLVIGADPFVMSPKEWSLYENTIQKSGHILLPTSPNLVDSVWENRPNPPKKKIYNFPLKYSGKDSREKLKVIQDELFSASVSDNSKKYALIITKLDEIAWLTNLRGNDIDYNPVFEAYAIIFHDSAICFCHKSEENLELFCPDWEFRPYEEYKLYLEEISRDLNLRVWLDPTSVTMGTRLVFSDEQIFEKTSPILISKAIKNKIEIESIKNTHVQAGLAVVKSFSRLAKVFERGQMLTEQEYVDLLFEEYSNLENFSELSFKTIAGSGPNGAIVHYSTPEKRQKMCRGEMLLVDSGIQCSGGTTDATRTVILGKPNAKQKRIYTFVLQAHIRLARQVFPEGTSGASLDSITRSVLWNSGLDYGHGTGHGVGAFLNVHEGPQSISPFAHDVALQKGMVVSNEPGYYEQNWGGIRLENLYEVKKKVGLKEHPDGKGWLSFETLTLIPFERKLIDRNLLSPDELNWLDSYHSQVMDKILPMLDNPEDIEWLNWACSFD